MKPFATVEVTAADLRQQGRVDATVFSRALARRADCTFWVPEHSGERSLPLVILLHGVYGSHWAWWGSGGAHLVAGELVAAGRLPTCVLAMPSDGLLGHGSGYVAQPGADVPAWILDEVPALASIVEPAVDPARPLALAGLSMGGFGALRLAAADASGRVVATAGLSSITAIEQMALFGVDPLPEVAGPSDRSVVAALDARTTPPPRLYLACGRDDLLIEHNRALHEALAARDIDHEWVEDDGTHEWDYWRRHLPAVLEFVGGALADGGT
jgi:S-formylglutathione hydrolase FrmB